MPPPEEEDGFQSIVGICRKCLSRKRKQEQPVWRTADARKTSDPL